MFRVYVCYTHSFGYTTLNILFPHMDSVCVCVCIICCVWCAYVCACERLCPQYMLYGVFVNLPVYLYVGNSYMLYNDVGCFLYSVTIFLINVNLYALHLFFSFVPRSYAYGTFGWCCCLFFLGCFLRSLFEALVHRI